MATLKTKNYTQWVDGRDIVRDSETFQFFFGKLIADKDEHSFGIEDNYTDYYIDSDAEVGFAVENSSSERAIIGTCKDGEFSTLFFERNKFLCSIDKMTILEKTANGFDLIVFKNPCDRTPEKILHYNEKLEQLEAKRNGLNGSDTFAPNKRESETQNLNPNNKKMTKRNGIFDSMLSAYKSQFLPEKENNINISTDGTLCVRDTNGAFIGINKDNELVEYPEGLTVQIPVFSINKKTADVKAGDIIKNKNSFSKVIEKKADGTLRCLSFSGYNQNRKQIKNVLLGTAMTRVVLNLFDFGANGGDATTKMLPLLLLGEGGFGGGDTLETIVMMQMLGGNANGGVQGLLPFLLLKDGKFGGGDTLETIAMMQMLGGNANGGVQGLLPFLLLKDGKFGGEGLETIMAMQMLGGGENPFANIANIFGGTAAPTPAPAATPAAPAETAEGVTEE